MNINLLKSMLAILGIGATGPQGPAGPAGAAAAPMVVSNAPPSNADGRPDGTVYIQTV